MMVDINSSLKGFPERVYVSTRKVYGEYTQAFSVAVDDLDMAVKTGDPVEVGIYQLVRVAKFQKTAVEIKTLKELETK